MAFISYRLPVSALTLYARADRGFTFSIPTLELPSSGSSGSAALQRSQPTMHPVKMTKSLGRLTGDVQRFGGEKRPIQDSIKKIWQLKCKDIFHTADRGRTVSFYWSLSDENR